MYFSYARGYSGVRTWTTVVSSLQWALLWGGRHQTLSEAAVQQHTGQSPQFTYLLSSASCLALYFRNLKRRQIWPQQKRVNVEVHEYACTSPPIRSRHVTLCVIWLTVWLIDLLIFWLCFDSEISLAIYPARGGLVTVQVEGVFHGLQPLHWSVVYVQAHSVLLITQLHHNIPVNYNTTLGWKLF